MLGMDCYRVGGDEFALISLHNEDIDVQWAIIESCFYEPLDVGMQQYESLIAPVLAQAGVPRAKAWLTALSQQSKYSGTSLAQVRLETETTGREHSLAVGECRALKPTR
mgnify:CR=1 FL=1